MMYRCTERLHTFFSSFVAKGLIRIYLELNSCCQLENVHFN